MHKTHKKIYQQIENPSQTPKKRQIKFDILHKDKIATQKIGREGRKNQLFAPVKHLKIVL